ncbi:MAG: class I SAM-dependent methyltransferase [Anaerolineae bacterium]|nr:class I SAM-dependent methyltransferase [Anaerolineae bacterium]
MPQRVEPTTETAYRTDIYERYLTTTYAPRNDMSDEGLQRDARHYDREFGAFLPAEKTAAILEIGSGKGGFLLCCQQLGYHDVTGTDISPEQVTFCHEQGFTNVVCADGLSYLQSCERQYALIAMIDVLEHLTKNEAVATLKAIYEHLLPGGRVILRVPNMSNPLNLRTRYVDFTHEIGLSRESLQQLLRLIGFEIETVHGAFSEHKNWLTRIVFDRLLWWGFCLLYRHTLHLTQEVVRGKNLIGVGKRPASL